MLKQLVGREHDRPASPPCPATTETHAVSTIVMLNLARRALAGLAVSWCLSATPGLWGRATADDQDLAQALRAAGPAIVLRDGKTIANEAGKGPYSFESIAAQRIPSGRC
jgi:hypothetical protein